MTTLQTLDWMLVPEDKRLSPVLSGLLITLSIFSWTLSEMLMAPSLKSFFVLFWLAYTAAGFGLVAWFFRINHVFETPWVSYTEGLSAAAQALLPCHVLLPVALIFQGKSFTGSMCYEVAKIAIVLAIVQRTMLGLKTLTRWPQWAALLLTISPIGVGIFGFVMLLVLSAFGAVIILVGGLS